MMPIFERSVEVNLFLLLILPLVCTACNKNTKTTHEGIEYILVKGCHKIYTEANEDCESEGTSAGKRGQLAILDTESKVNALDSSFWQEDRWIGLSDRTTESTFVWIDGTPLDFQNLEGHSPGDSGNSDDKDCVVMKVGTGRWEVSKSCSSDNLWYLCEIRPDTMETTEAGTTMEDATSAESLQTTEVTTTMQEITVTTLLQILKGVKSKMYCLATCQQMESCESVIIDKESMTCYLYDGINLNSTMNLYITTFEKFENKFKIGIWDKNQ